MANHSENRPDQPSDMLRILPLGGVGEIGKNMYVFEYGDDIVVMGQPADDGTSTYFFFEFQRRMPMKLMRCARRHTHPHQQQLLRQRYERIRSAIVGLS
jgi:hypothetical protein